MNYLEHLADHEAQTPRTEFVSSDCHCCKLKEENEKLRKLISNYDHQLDLATKHFLKRKDTGKKSLHASIVLWKISLRAETYHLNRSK